MRKIAAAALLAAGALAGAARAAPSCAVPARLPTPHVERPSADEPRRMMAIGGYTLAMIWSPQSCREGARNTEGIGCRGTRGFVLHGLWPDGEDKDWPQWCSAAPVLKPSTIRANYCATPSAQLQQHEWAKHGTCMPGYTPERYFRLSSGLFAGLRWPAMAALSRQRELTARDFARAFAAANPGMRGDMVRLNLDREGWLQEVWLCLDTRFRPARCAATQGGAKADAPVRIWRGKL